MQETLERQKLRKNLDAEEKVPVLDYLAFSLYKQDNLQRAWWITNELLKIGNFEIYHKHIFLAQNERIFLQKLCYVHVYRAQGE